MQLAVISDIHGNMEAFSQVLNDIERSGIDAVICLGDNIGYGPEPDQVVSLIRDRNIPSVMGNHELAVVDKKYLAWFNSAARLSLEKTLELLSEKTIHFISSLRVSLVCYGCRFVHGFPPDSITTYLFGVSDDRLSGIMQKMKEKMCFVGHTHNLEIVGFDGHTVTRAPLHKGVTTLRRDRRYIVNIGAVGQPRDGNNKAKYVIWDTSDNTIEVKLISYDIASVANKILEAGLPEVHARRLL